MGTNEACRGTQKPAIDTAIAPLGLKDHEEGGESWYPGGGGSA